jgi:hypothetical protein
MGLGVPMKVLSSSKNAGTKDDLIIRGADTCADSSVLPDQKQKYP